MNAYSAAMRRYFDFSGRSSRRDFWMFVLIVGLAYIVLAASLPYLFGQAGVWAYLLVGLVHIIPSYAVSVRRLHDMGKSGWWYLLSFIPFGGLVLLYWACQPSQPGYNAYGPNPYEGTNPLATAAA